MFFYVELLQNNEIMCVFVYVCLCAYACLSGCLIGDLVTICLLVLSVFIATCLLTAGNTNSIDSSEATVMVNVCFHVCVCLRLCVHMPPTQR